MNGRNRMLVPGLVFACLTGTLPADNIAPKVSEYKGNLQKEGKE